MDVLFNEKSYSLLIGRKGSHLESRTPQVFHENLPKNRGSVVEEPCTWETNGRIFDSRRSFSSIFLSNWIKGWFLSANHQMMVGQQQYKIIIPNGNIKKSPFPVQCPTIWTLKQRHYSSDHPGGICRQPFIPTGSEACNLSWASGRPNMLERTCPMGPGYWKSVAGITDTSAPETRCTGQGEILPTTYAGESSLSAIPKIHLHDKVLDFSMKNSVD